MLSAEFLLYSLVLCLYFIRNCFFVLIVAHFAFCLYLQHITQTYMTPAGFELATSASDRSQTLALDCSATGIGRIRSPDRPARSELLYRLSYAGPQSRNRTKFTLIVSVRKSEDSIKIHLKDLSCDDVDWIDLA